MCKRLTIVILSLSSLLQSNSLYNFSRYLKMTTKRKTRSISNDASINENKKVKEIILLDLGPLISAVILRRPSSLVKSPYVADIIELKAADHETLVFPLLLSDDNETMESPKKKSPKKKIDHSQSIIIKMSSNSDTIKLAHAPSLDCAGIVVPGAKVYCTAKKAGSSTKTDYVIQHCEEIREDNSKTIVGYHPSLAETLAKEIISKNYIVDIIGLHDIIRQQVTFGQSRVDFVITNEKDKTTTLIEVKNVVGATFVKGQVPATRSKVGVYEVVDPDVRYAIFPHGAVKSGIGVVSDRAIKHIHELTELVGTKTDDNMTIKSVILFIINRSDCSKFRPCHEADLLFAQVLQKAIHKGVTAIAQEIIWHDSIAKLGQRLPIHFDEKVTKTEIDTIFLQKVLEYNETFKR